jgi:hypothetical protein
METKKIKNKTKKSGAFDIRRIVSVEKDFSNLQKYFGAMLSRPVPKKYLGKTYRWMNFWEKFFRIIFVFTKKTFVMAGRISCYSIVFGITIAVVFSVIPKVLSDQKLVTVDLKADFERGTLTNVNTDGAQDAIQLEPEGSWESKVWTPAPETIGYGSSSVMAGNYLYLTRGYASKNFWRYDTANNTWEDLPDLPLPASYGADLAYYSGTGEIFAIFGGYSTGFYKYNIANEEWSELEDLLDAPYSGASIESDGEDIYFVKGNTASDFYRYNVNGSGTKWETLSGANGNVAVGGNLVYGNDDYMYLVRGNGYVFDRYKIRGSGAGIWTGVANINVSGTNYTITGETKGVYWTDGTIKYLYFLRSGGTANVLRYQITCDDGTDGTCAGEKNTWELVTESGYGTPAVTNFASLAYNETEGYMYAVQGNGSQNIWKLDPDGTSNQMWVGPKQVQNAAGALQNVGTGGDLIYCNGSLQTILGGNAAAASQHYLYNPSTNTWSNGGTTGFYQVNNDVKGTCYNNTVYFPRSGSNVVYTSTGGAWSSLANNLPANAGDGAGMAYNSGDSRIYALRGWASGTAGTNDLFYQAASGGAWSNAADISVTDGGTTLNYYPNAGARIVSDETNLFVTIGAGETTFLRYNTGSNTWTKMTSTPFPQYYGVDLTYNNGKIYALAGYYRDETWEYDISGNSWRKLPRNQKFSYGRGPYNGASLEAAGAGTLYATNGLGIPDMWKYSISSTNYPESGIYESEAINLFYVDGNITFTVNSNTPTDTTIGYSYIMSDDGVEWDSEFIPFSVTEGTGTITSTHHKYIKIKITLGSQGASRVSTPTVYDYSLSYNSNDTRPVNPTNITGSSVESGGVPITNGNAEGYPYAHPYFVWSGATHNGSGIAEYYVCFDTDANCSDPETSGSYQTSSYYTVNKALETGTYHLKIKTKDNNGNLSSSVWDAFTYIYKGVSNPVEEDPLHVTKTTEADFNGGQELSDVDAFDNGGVGSMRLESTSGFWNQNRLSLALGTISIGGELALGACKTIGAVPAEITSDRHCLYTFRGNNTTTFYRYEIETDTWTAMAVSPMAVYSGSYLVEGPNNTLYASRGASSTAPTNYKAFWSYDILSDTWTVLPNAPKDFNYGSNMAYDGSQYIYIMPGNDDVFYRYDTTNGNWTAKTSANFGNLNSSNGQYTYVGSDSIYDNRNNVYVIQGSSTATGGLGFPYFSKYSIADDSSHGETANTWTPLASAPIGFYYSGSLAYDQDTNAIYAIAGNYANSNATYNARQFFLKYDIDTNTWSNLPDAPANLTGEGGSLLAYGGYVYFTRGSASTNFYRFNISENSWELPKNGFFGPFIPTGNVLGVNSNFPYGNGTYITNGDGNNIYVTRGSFDNSFGKYDARTGSFTELARLPVGASTGASLAYDNNEGMIYYVPGAIYTTRSSSNNYFFKYNILTNSWSEVSTSVRPDAQVGAGSSMAYDGSRYIYLTRGAGGTSWWRYDTCRGGGVGCTVNWSANLNNPASANWAQEAGARIVYKNGIMYSIRGGGNTTNGRYFFSCDVQNTTLPGNCWTRSAGTDLPSGVVVSTGGSLIDGNDGYLYVVVGNGTNTYYRYNIATPGWEAVSGIPAQPTTGGSGTYQSNRNWTTSGAGTNSYSDGLYSYVVGSTTNGTGFQKTGTYTSEVMDMTSVYDWANLTVDYTLPDTSTTFLAFETRTSATGSLDQGDEGEWSAWAAATNDHTVGTVHTLNIASPTNRYIQVRITFTSSDQIFSPRVDEFSIYYYQDIGVPENPTSSTAYDKAGTGKAVITNPSGVSWFSHTQPYFEWPVAGTAGGASDSPNPGGSGIAGYYVCFGVGEDCDDAYGDGDFQAENYFTAPLLAANSTDYTNSGKTYNLLVKAVDNGGLIDSESYQVFVYNFDNRVPTNPTGLTVTPLGYTAIDNFAFVWNSDAVDPATGSELEKLEYQCGDEDEDDLANWHELDTDTVNLTLPLYDGETLVHAGAYNPSGENIFRLRAVDKAGNRSAYLEQKFYFSSTAPTPPLHLEVEADPEEENKFTFSWERPASFTGDPTKLKYYYSVNTLPNAYNTVETTATAAGPGPFATQREWNRFYVVAKDETGNIDYGVLASVDFYADTSAPGPPNTVQAFDTSNRETEEYSVAIKWSRPTVYNEGNFAGYAILRSEDNETFEEVATTTGLAFIDVDLESKLYYYYVQSKDKTNNYSVASTTVSLVPTGKYTSPPNIVSQPSVTVKAYAANVVWSTDRVASSFVEYATSIGAVGTIDGKTAGQDDNLTSHEVDVLGLSAGTKYYYRAKFVDVDGNRGVSDIGTFETLPAPTISEVSISEIGLNSATISWTTNTSATCTLKYGKGNYGSTVEESGGGTTHVQKLTGLESSSVYVFQIDGIDGDLNTFNSDEYTFTTLTQPTVSDLSVQNKENVDIPTVSIAYKTSHPTTTLIKFKGSNEGSYHNYLVNEYVTEHTAEIADLDPAVEYELIATGVDANGVEALSQTMKITTLTDSRPPGVLSNRAVGRVVGRGKDARANLYIRIETDEISTTKVLFGKGTIMNNFEQSTGEDGLNTYHLITIPVDPGQVYSYIIEIKDEAGNKVTTKTVTVVIESSKDNATEIIVNTFSNKFGWLQKIWTRQ